MVDNVAFPQYRYLQVIYLESNSDQTLQRMILAFASRTLCKEVICSSHSNILIMSAQLLNFARQKLARNF